MAKVNGSANGHAGYAERTHRDPNPLKRWVQGRRLEDALRWAERRGEPSRIVDFGCGDGELCRRAAQRWPGCEVVGFEPAAELRAQATAAGIEGVRYVEAEAQLPEAWADVVFCTEVFEHLPDAETETALREIHRILSPDGRVVIGVPVEVGPPAAAKGLFRMLRRWGDEDARPGPVLAAMAGRPKKSRFRDWIAPGRAYFPHHIGFDHRPLIRRLAPLFRVEQVAGSPLAALPVWLNSEAYIVARRAGDA
ncbi:class I SAM-dependent methyltransferase [Brevundimonas sp. 2R-24]|uniref:Class I SAM-dependent methyltransferase n=1 Tax=Peiella sedimenti TaxID=3061083 RepID=A0ABT8SMD5_9CAUL|nr:class I SAM-dependent methyltransferase [Caulobacteraceae bacterium XZ-24]